MDKKLRKEKIIAERIKGKSIRDVAKKVDCSTTTVQKVLTTAEAKEMIEKARLDVISMSQKAIDAMRWILDNREEFPQLAEKVSKTILESVGAVTRNVIITAETAKPSIIERWDGSVVEIGVLSDIKEVNDVGTGSK